MDILSCALELNELGYHVFNIGNGHSLSVEDNRHLPRTLEEGLQAWLAPKN